MKRLIALGIGVFGLRALIRRRRSRTAHADELREKLAAHRTAVESAPEPEPESEAPKPEAAPPDAAPPDDVEARRADVHARARRKIDELSG